MEKPTYIDNVLIKLKRKYRKDEVLSALIKENSEFKIEIGKLKSEIDFIEDNHKKELLKLKSYLKSELNVEIQKEIKFSKLKIENNEQKRIIKNLRMSISNLIANQNKR